MYVHIYVLMYVRMYICIFVIVELVHFDCTTASAFLKHQEQQEAIIFDIIRLDLLNILFSLCTVRPVCIVTVSQVQCCIDHGVVPPFCLMTFQPRGPDPFHLSLGDIPVS